MPSWLQELLALVSLLPSTAGGVPPLEVPALPVTSAAAASGPTQVFADGFDAPYAERWSHLVSSTADKVTQTSVDGRTVIELRPEAHLEFGTAVPFEPGTTYRVSANLKMPNETGVHPAFWLRTNDLQRAGEIDVVESWGQQNGCGRVQVAYYWRYSPPIGEVECAGDRYPADMDAWHTYSVEFTYQGPGQDPAAETSTPTRFFVDGVETWSTPHAPGRGRAPPPPEQAQLPRRGAADLRRDLHHALDVRRRRHRRGRRARSRRRARRPDRGQGDRDGRRGARAQRRLGLHRLREPDAVAADRSRLALHRRRLRRRRRRPTSTAIRMAGRNTAQVQVLDGGDLLHSDRHATRRSSSAAAGSAGRGSSPATSTATVATTSTWSQRAGPGVRT